MIWFYPVAKNAKKTKSITKNTDVSGQTCESCILVFLACLNEFLPGKMCMFVCVCLCVCMSLCMSVCARMCVFWRMSTKLEMREGGFLWGIQSLTLLSGAVMCHPDPNFRATGVSQIGASGTTQTLAPAGGHCQPWDGRNTRGGICYQPGSQGHQMGAGALKELEPQKQHSHCQRCPWNREGNK